MAKVSVDYDKYKDCPGTSWDSDDHTCPRVIYDNVDGLCQHWACEGPHDECGEIIDVIE